jgi:hypothetical protein
MGGVYNAVNLHVYHYAGNNPVKYKDPDGKWIALKKQADRFNNYIGSGARNSVSSDYSGSEFGNITIKSPEAIRKDAEGVYNKNLPGMPSPEEKKQAVDAANKVIDNFIRSKDPSYNPPVKDES